tara:strand:- start:1668 stop:2753 length:1086 start_codon:yes stop_codon:yes gene_type:complete
VRFLLVADAHWTDDPREAGRFELFKALVRICKNEKVDRVLFLGDITDKKDRHSGRFINQLIKNFRYLYDNVMPQTEIEVLIGNHDFTDPENPTFLLLEELGIRVFVRPELVTLKDVTAAYMPFTRDPVIDWAVYEQGLSAADVIFIHQPLEGAKSENGMVLEHGLHPNYFDIYAKGTPVFAGDVHVRQKCGPVQYIGAPYKIHFGDEYEGHVSIYDTETKKEHPLKLHLGIPEKRLVTLAYSHEAGMDDISLFEDYEGTKSLSPDSQLAKLKKGDLLKVRIVIMRNELEHWDDCEERVRRACEHHEFELCGIELDVRVDGDSDDDLAGLAHETDENVLKRFCEKEELSVDVLDAGLSIIRG